jgi:uncharacterized protein DUF3574
VVLEKERAMRRLILRAMTTIAVTFSVLIANPVHVAGQGDELVVRRPIPLRALADSFDFARTELFFGTAKPDGTVVTEAEFMAFVDAQVTPRFPDGVTLLRGNAQFRGETGEIVKEDSFILILLYPVGEVTVSNRRIETIRRLYKEAFQQESVIRIDNPFAVRVSF